MTKKKDKTSTEAPASVETVKQPATEQAATEQAATEQAATEQAATEQAATEQAATEQAATEQAATEQAATEQAATGQAATEQAATEQAATEQAATEQAATEQPGIDTQVFKLTLGNALKQEMRERIAADVFKEKDVSELYFTSDMVPFFLKSDAINHASTLLDKEVFNVQKK